MTTTNEQWMPLGVQESDVAAFTALRQDIPPWLAPSLWEWISGMLMTIGEFAQQVVDVGLLRQAERILHVELPTFQAHRVSEGLTKVRQWYLAQDTDTKLTFIDFLISRLNPTNPRVKVLEQLLAEGRSGWRVGTRAGNPGLVQRLPEGVTAAAAATFQQPNAGKRLRAAWEVAFGVNPNPAEAYRLAVKAVEAASAPIVIPNDPDPSLGKVISRILQGGQFRLPHLREEPNGTTSHDVLLYNLKQLWWGQYDRHDGLQESPLPDDVTQPEAESAVLLAVTLVGWFESGHVQP